VKQPWTGLPAIPRPLVRRHGRRASITDVLLWGVLALPVVGDVIGDPDRAAWAKAGGVLLLAVAVAVGRTWPLTALAIVFALTAVHGNFVFGIPVMSYLAGRRTEQARPVLWVFTAVLLLGSLLNLVRGVSVETWFPLTVYLVLLGVVPWLVGRSWRQYQQLVLSGWERAEHLEHEQRIIADQERLRERSRIAQDMHDSLGHELSLIALRAGALEIAPDLDEHRRLAAGELRSSATMATERLREIIGVLRDGSDPAPVGPPDEGIADLVDRARASGMLVELDGRVAPVAPMVDRAGYRVVQEALTNATKHAPGAAVTVRLAQTEDQTTVTVTNEPPPEPPPPDRTRGHRGLAGLRERVRLVGGALREGETPDGGFTVVARLPHVTRAVALHEDADQEDGWSESAHQLAHARQQVRRGAVTAIVAPVGLLACLGLVMVSYYVYMTFNSVLPPDDFHRLRVGQNRAEVEALLPDKEQLGGPIVHDPPAPAGADCRYYRADANLLGLSRRYRLCFAADRLVAKDDIPTRNNGPDSPSR
jgi:signal transduction histidine kinase